LKFWLAAKIWWRADLAVAQDLFFCLAGFPVMLIGTRVSDDLNWYTFRELATNSCVAKHHEMIFVDDYERAFTSSAVECAD
jgi:hypothetical protein